MYTFKVNQWTEIFILDSCFIYILRSFTYDCNFLYEIRSHDLLLIRQGTYAYCYDFIANLAEK